MFLFFFDKSLTMMVKKTYNEKNKKSSLHQNEVANGKLRKCGFYLVCLGR